MSHKKCYYNHKNEKRDDENQRHVSVGALSNCGFSLLHIAGAGNLAGFDRVLFVTGVTTGMRKAEIQHLQWCDVDLVYGRVFVKSKPARVVRGHEIPAHTIKDYEDRVIPLTRLCIGIDTEPKLASDVAPAWPSVTKMKPKMVDAS